MGAATTQYEQREMSHRIRKRIVVGTVWQVLVPDTFDVGMVNSR
jgi:hypothetical protein